MAPRVEAAAVRPAAKAGEYPARPSAGIRTEPVAAQSAVAEPDAPDIARFAPMMTWARPPVMRATNSAAKSMRRWVIPPFSMNRPAMTKNGNARNGNEFEDHQHSLADHDERKVRAEHDREDGSHSHRDGNRSAHYEQQEKAAEK